MQNEDANHPSDVLKPGETINYAYVETIPGFSWYKDSWYQDTLCVKAVAAFIKSTHEVCYAIPLEL